MEDTFFFRKTPPMKIVQESAEHHFLTLLDKIRQDSGGWIGLHFGFSQKLDHADIIAEPGRIKEKLTKLHDEAQALVAGLKARAGNRTEAVTCLFTDCDVIFLARPQNEQERSDLSGLFRDLADKAGGRFCSQGDLSKEIYEYQKIADARLLGARRFEAYRAMADANRIQSIGLRRQRRDEPLILMVEDDRFTAAYASTILGKEYELVPAKTGEDAILAYIEHAPDVVFLDIHLPGLSGQETLKALRKADPEAYVVMLSVDTARNNVVGASKDGAAAFLKKPFSKERVVGLVKQSPFKKQH